MPNQEISQQHLDGVKYYGEDDVSDKMKFIRKVYAILTAQLVLTAAMIAGVQYSEKMRLF